MIAARAAVFWVGLASMAWTTAQSTKSPQPAWYTQIGQWQQQRDSLTGQSFLFHDDSTDGASSGQARANVKLNTPLEDILRFSARLSLGPAPASAGLLVKNKRVTYYFLLRKGTGPDSLHISSYRDKHLSLMLAAPVKILDTTVVELSVRGGKLDVAVGSSKFSLDKPHDFDSLRTVGFECPQGSVRVYDAEVEARGFVLKETFDKATLMNLHLDKMFKGSAKPSSGSGSVR